ncbi:hypothetical protein D3C77_574180 [compost metagenome]
MKLTDDGKYEYHLEIINLFQRNSYARLCVKDTSSGNETRIKTEIKTRKIRFLMINKDMVWATLDSTDVEGVYYLTTTSDLKIPEERYEVVIGKGVAYKIN